jgi:2'-5' RNA ligase
MALIPPEPIRSEVTGFKQLVAQKFNSSRALSSPPHITLVPPFRYDPRQVDVLLTAMYRSTTRSTPFYITLNGFRHFSNKVVFIDVEKNDDLSQLQGTINAHFMELLHLKKDKKPFHPHMTIGFRDLDPPNFVKAWNFFEKKDYFRVFEAKEVFLLKHNGQQWLIQNQISLNE